MYKIRYKIIFILLLTLTFYVNLAQAELLDTYLEDFTDYKDNTTIEGVDHWQVTHGSIDGAITQSGVTPTGSGKALELIGASTCPDAQRPYAYGSLTPAWISFQVRPAYSGERRSIPTTGISVVTFDYTGKILTNDAKTWIDTGQTYTPGEWYDVTLKLNFKDHTYDLYLSPTTTPKVQFIPVKTNLGFIDSSVNSLGALKFHGAYSTTQSSNVFIDNILISYIDRLEIITPPQKIMVDKPSDPITVQIQSSQSAPQTAIANMTLDLKTTSGKGKFSLERSPWQDVTQIVLPKDSQSVTFYYKDGLSGKPMINVAEYPDYGYTDGLQEEEIVSVYTFFDVKVDPKQVAGQNFKIKITAKSEAGAVDENYSGTAVLSINYISPLGGIYDIMPKEASGFVKGVLEIDALYPDCGTITITATDSQDSAKTGTSNQILFLPASFSVSADISQTVSMPFNLTITAKNAKGATAPNYNGDVNMSIQPVAPQDISQAILSPQTISGSVFIKGVANVNTSYNLFGTVKLKAQDATDATKTGISNEINFLPKRISLDVAKPLGGRDFFYLGEPIGIIIKIEDDLGNPIPNYIGNIILSSSTGLSVPNQYAFINEDAGQHTVSGTSGQAGIYTVVVQTEDGRFKAETPQITVKNATIQVLDTTAAIGSGEVIIQIVDDQGNVITAENNLTINIKAIEDLDNQSVSLPSSTVTFTDGRAIVPVNDTEAEVVTIIPSSLYQINIKKGTITFGHAGKTGIAPLMWRELKGQTQ